MKTVAMTSTGLDGLTRATVIVGILAVITACTAVEELIISKELDGTSWRAVNIDGFSVPKDVDVTMSFNADRSVNGTAGCNNYMVKNVRTKGGVAFTQIATTRMLCQEPQMATENRFVDALSRVKNFRRNSDGQLLIFGRDMVTTLDPAP